MAENENGMSKKKKVAIITASVVLGVAVLFLAIFLPIYLTQKSSETETVESNLPSGSTLNELIKGSDSNYEEANTTVKRIVFDYYDKDESGAYTQTEDGNYTYTEDDVNVLEEQEAESYVWNDVQIDVYRVSDADGTTVYFLSTEEIVANEDMGYSFYNFTSVEEIAFNNFNTSSMTNMDYMFANCTSLKTLDVSKWDVSNVTSMWTTFSSCAFETLDVSNWDTSSVTHMGSLFLNCSSLTEIDVSNWNTSNVTLMWNLFSGCSSLTSLDLSKWDTSSVTSMAWMFNSCTSLQEIKFSDWDVSNVVSMQGMFYGCRSLTSFDVSKWDTSSAENMYMMFAYSGWTSTGQTGELDLSGWNTSKVTNMSAMFAGNSKLTAIYVGEGWSTDAVETDSSMFSSCTSLPYFTENGSDTTSKYAYAGYSEKLEAYGYLTLKVSGSEDE